MLANERYPGDGFEKKKLCKIMNPYKRNDSLTFSKLNSLSCGEQSRRSL
jgi:hypothetical protein